MFDEIRCINLKNRKDKYIKVKKMFENIDLEVNFFFAEKHPKSGRIGCFESHVNVIKECYNKNGKYILIFEDDAINTASYKKESIKFISNFLYNNNWCEYFQLGYTILPHEILPYFNSKKLISNNNNSILNYSGNTAHAYILNRNGMKRILNTWEESLYDKEMDLDLYYKEIFKNNGASICPILFDQDFCINSDNEKATSTYYKFLRDLSCYQYQYSYLYCLSILRFYIIYFLIFIIIFLIIFFYFIYSIKYSKKKLIKKK